MYKNMIKNKQKGVTLIELMITLAVAAVLTVVALPDLTAMIQNNRIASQANDLIGAMNLARSEAIKRGVQANVCAANTTQTACGNNWSNGWLVYVDQTSTGAITTLGSLQNTDIILKARPQLRSGNTLRSTDLQISYLSSGFSDAAQAFSLCDERGNDFGRVISITNTGRAATARTTNQCP